MSSSCSCDARRTPLAWYMRCIVIGVEPGCDTVREDALTRVFMISSIRDATEHSAKGRRENESNIDAGYSVYRPGHGFRRVGARSRHGPRGGRVRRRHGWCRRLLPGSPRDTTLPRPDLRPRFHAQIRERLQEGLRRSHQQQQNVPEEDPGAKRLWRDAGSAKVHLLLIASPAESSPCRALRRSSSRQSPGQVSRHGSENAPTCSMNRRKLDVDDASTMRS